MKGLISEDVRAMWAFAFRDTARGKYGRMLLLLACSAFWVGSVLVSGRDRGAFDNWAAVLLQEEDGERTWFGIYVIVLLFVAGFGAHSLSWRALLLPVPTRRLARWATGMFCVAPALVVFAEYAVAVRCGMVVVNDGRLHYLPALVAILPVLLGFSCGRSEVSLGFRKLVGAWAAMVTAMAIVPCSGGVVAHLAWVLGLIVASTLVGYSFTCRNLTGLRRAAGETGLAVETVRADWRWYWQKARGAVDAVLSAAVALVLLVAVARLVSKVRDVECLTLAWILAGGALCVMVVAGARVLGGGGSMHQWIVSRTVPVNKRVRRLVARAARLGLLVGAGAALGAVAACASSGGFAALEDLRRMCGDEVGTVAVNVLRGIVLLWAATWVTTQISLPLLIAPWCGLSGVIVALLIGEGGEHISVPISFALLPAAIVAVVYGPRQFALARRRRLISNSTCVRAGLAWLVLVALFCFDSVGSRPVFGLAWGVFIATMAVAPVAGLPLWCDDVRPGWSPTLRLRWSGYTEEVWGEDGQEKGVYSEHM